MRPSQLGVLTRGMRNFLTDNYYIALIDLGMVTMAQSWMQLAEHVARMNIDLEAEHLADDNGEVIFLDRTQKN